ncbi:MAG: type II secretion system F family protein, partial [Planctomycetota bacterium]|nr:type II secretion system F family protein [Planctomycetota bacterium]
LLLASLATMAIVGPTLSVVLACVYGGVIAGVVLIARRLGRGDSALERYPLIGKVLLQLRELPYLEALHALYGAGVPIVEAHRTALATVRLQDLRKQLSVAQEMLEQGRTLQEALETSASLSLETRTLLATGEQAGELEDALQRALVRRTEMAEQQLQRAARVAGTVAYVSAAIGVVVIAVRFYTSYYGPLFALLR